MNTTLLVSLMCGLLAVNTIINVNTTNNIAGTIYIPISSSKSSFTIQLASTRH